MIEDQAPSQPSLQISPYWRLWVPTRLGGRGMLASSFTGVTALPHMDFRNTQSTNMGALILQVAGAGFY